LLTIPWSVFTFQFIGGTILATIGRTGLLV
jgi:hypothetical protein